MTWSVAARERWKPEVQRGWVILGAMVKRRRIELGWSQRQTELFTGVDQSAISRLETGKLSGMRMSKFARLVAAMNGLDPAAPHPTDLPTKRTVGWDWD
jgi:Helix-turn-helix domain